MQLDLQGKVALVTGAGSGIGEAAAKKLAAAGAQVAALGRTDDELTDVVNEMRSQGCQAISLVADISDLGST